ncbi:MAG: hypothetical protein JW963_25655 [Anaerolineales bacterium]|nr:hypothetical protein [Anaerolineales bacterium]
MKLHKVRQVEVHLRSMERRLARMLELDPAPLNIPRPLESNCRPEIAGAWS